MNQALKDYLEFSQKYSDLVYLNREQRKGRHDAIICWEKQVYEHMPDRKETIEFMMAYQKYIMVRPFCEKILVPCVQKELEQGIVEGVRYLFELSAFDGIINTGQDYIYNFCNITDFQYNSIQLADLILKQDPEHKAALFYKYYVLKHWVQYTIHEAPWIILNGRDSAGKSDLPSMMRDLARFEELAKKLKRDEKELIEQCEVLYGAWGDYLDHLTQYQGFEDYVSKHQIPFC